MDEPQGQRFRRLREDFECENCKRRICGNGFTDHCPKCLVGKHVDINPGDRSSKCKGTMLPIHTTYARDCFIIYYKCAKCGTRWRVKAADDDNRELMMAMLIS